MSCLLGLFTLVVVAARTAPAQETFTVPHQAPPAHVPQLTKAPALLKFVPAHYPPEAEAQGLSGDVGLEVQIAADGKVADARVTRSAGHGFDEAALSAVREFLFSPAEIDGKPAAVAIDYTYHFTLESPPASLGARRRSPGGRERPGSRAHLEEPDRRRAAATRWAGPGRADG
jgi:TonB family protein